MSSNRLNRNFSTNQLAESVNWSEVTSDADAKDDLTRQPDLQRTPNATLDTQRRSATQSMGDPQRKSLREELRESAEEIVAASLRLPTDDDKAKYSRRRHHLLDSNPDEESDLYRNSNLDGSLELSDTHVPVEGDPSWVVPTGELSQTSAVAPRRSNQFEKTQGGKPLREELKEATAKTEGNEKRGKRKFEGRKLEERRSGDLSFRNLNKDGDIPKLGWRDDAAIRNIDWRIRAAQVIYDYTPREPFDLALREREILKVHRIYEDGWWEVENMEGACGLVPQTYVRVIGPDDERIFAMNDLQEKQEQEKQERDMRHEAAAKKKRAQCACINRVRVPVWVPISWIQDQLKRQEQSLLYVDEGDVNMHPEKFKQMQQYLTKEGAEVAQPKDQSEGVRSKRQLFKKRANRNQSNENKHHVKENKNQSNENSGEEEEILDGKTEGRHLRGRQRHHGGSLSDIAQCIRRFAVGGDKRRRSESLTGRKGSNRSNRSNGMSANNGSSGDSESGEDTGSRLNFNAESETDLEYDLGLSPSKEKQRKKENEKLLALRNKIERKK